MKAYTIFYLLIFTLACTNSKEDNRFLQKSKNKTDMISIQNQLMTWSNYELIGSAQSYKTLISALSEKAKKSFNGIARYSFYVNEKTGVAGAIIIYDSPQAFIDWHELAPDFEEYEEFKKTVKPNGLKLYGNLPPKTKEWIDDKNVPYEYVGTLAGGFIKELY